jgi:hypothetical protein
LVFGKAATNSAFLLVVTSVEKSTSNMRWLWGSALQIARAVVVPVLFAPRIAAITDTRGAQAFF